MKQYLLPVLAGSMLLSSATVLAAGTSTTEMKQKINLLSQQTKELKEQMLYLQHRVESRQLTAGPEKTTEHPISSGQSSASQGGLAVITTPSLGIKRKYDASDVLAQTSSMNEDLTLLKQHQNLDHYLKGHGYSASHPVVELSGGLEGQIYTAKGFKLNNQTDKGITLSRAELDVNSFVGPWALGFLSLSYSNAPSSSGSREPVSSVYLKRGFITLGNLQEAPVYFTIGETYVPFGKFSSLMLSTPVTESMARIRDTAATIGYSDNGLYAQLSSFPGDRTSGSHSVFKQVAANLGYGQSISGGKFDLGTGWVSNLADSQGMQGTGNATANQFSGFSGNNNTGAVPVLNALRHDVRSMDVHGTLSYNPWTFVAEYVFATDAFNSNDLSFNGRGAKVSAMHFETDYTFNLMGKALTAGVSYGQTKQALALNLPRYSWTFDLQSSLFEHTVETIEYRHDKDFSATANGGAAATAITGNGGTRNAVMLQIGAYF
jgi:hypothetical protein